MATVISQDEGVILMLEYQRLLERDSVEPEELPSLAYPVKSRAIPQWIVVIFSVSLVYLMGLVILAAAEVDILYLAVCYSIGADKATCSENPEANARANQFTSTNTIFRGILGLVANTIYGGLSDRIGRRPIIITTMAAGGCALMSTWYIVFRSSLTTYWWLLVPTAIDSAGGSTPVFSMMAISYVSDYVRDPAVRGHLLALLTAMSTFLVAIGPLIGSWIISEFNLETLFKIAVSLMLLSALLSALFLNESLNLRCREPDIITKRSWGDILSPLTFSHVKHPTDRRNASTLLFYSIIVAGFAMSFPVVLLLYTKRMFGWSAVERGYLISLISAVRTICLTLGYPYLCKLLGTYWQTSHSNIDYADKTLIQLVFLFASLGYLLMGEEKSSKGLYIGGVLDASSSLGSPALDNALLKYVPHGEVGSFLAATYLLVAILGTVLPSMLVKLYSLSFEWNPSLIFQLMFLVFGLLLISTIRLRPQVGFIS